MRVFRTPNGIQNPDGNFDLVGSSIVTKELNLRDYVTVVSMHTNIILFTSRVRCNTIVSKNRVFNYCVLEFFSLETFSLAMFLFVLVSGNYVADAVEDVDVVAVAAAEERARLS